MIGLFLIHSSILIDTPPYHIDKNSKGERILIHIKEDTSSKEIKAKLLDENCESLFVEIKIRKKSFACNLLQNNISSHLTVIGKAR